MKLGYLTAFVALVMCLSGTGLTAQTYPDPCIGLLQEKGEDQSTTWNFFRLFQQDEEIEEPTPISEHEYFVTIRPGRFSNVTCNSDNFESQEMYPLGIVVRLLHGLPTERYGNAVNGTPVMVLTEFGHRKIVAYEDIEPIHDRTYLFADSFDRLTFCRSIDDCPTNSAANCPDGKCKFHITGGHSYGLVEATNATFQAAYAAYRSIHKDALLWTQDDPINDLSSSERAKLTETTCAPFPVRAYKRGAVLHQPRPMAFTFCKNRIAAGAEQNSVGHIKVVDISGARRIFEFGHNGTFHRNFQENLTALGRAVAALGTARVSTAKKCGEELKIDGKVAFGAMLEAKVNAGVISSSVKAETSAGVALSTQMSKDEYILFSTYFIRPFQNAKQVGDTSENDALWLFRIVFRSKCENGSPRQPVSLTIYYDRLPGKSLEIGAKQGIASAYNEGIGKTAYVPKCDPNFLRQGHFWEVPDYIAYFLWRETLRDFMYGVPPALDLLAAYPTEQRPLVRDFFVHLMLTAAFYHKNPGSALPNPKKGFTECVWED